MAAYRYFRIKLAVSTSISTTEVISISEIELNDINGTGLLAQFAVPAVITVAGARLTTGDLLLGGNVIDNDLFTVCSFYSANVSWRSSFNADNNSLTIDTGVGQEIDPDHISITFSDVAVSTYDNIHLSSMQISVDVSLDNIIWVPISYSAENSKVDGSYNTPLFIPIKGNSKFHAYPSTSDIGGTGGIYGIVSEDGIALQGRPVYLFDRSTMSRIGYILTDSNGGYAFNGLNTIREYLLMSTDPSGPPYKNAMVWDRIKPINTLGSNKASNKFAYARTQIPGFAGYVGFIGVSATELSTSDTFAGGALSTWSLWIDSYNSYLGYGTDTNSSAAGEITYITSNSDMALSKRGTGIVGSFTPGCVNNNIDIGNTLNRSTISFELSLVTPSVGESIFIFGLSGCSSNDYKTYETSRAPWNYHKTVSRTLEILCSSTEIQVHAELGAANLDVVRGSVPIVSSSKYHIVLVYVASTTIKLYLNGVLATTIDITGAGDLWSTTYRLHFNNPTAYATYPGSDTRGYRNGVTGRLNGFYIIGEVPASTDARPVSGQGFGGAFGNATLYNSQLLQGHVDALYNSWLDPTTVVPVASLSGYMASIQEDSPIVYTRLNDVNPINGQFALQNGVGVSSYYTTTVGVVEYGNGAPFIYGAPSAKYTGVGCSVINNIDINSIFTIELFFRCADAANTATKVLVSHRLYDNNEAHSLYIEANKLILRIKPLAGANSVFDISTGIVDNTDYHIVVSFDPWNTKRLVAILNGVICLDATSSIVSTMYSNDQDDYNSNISIGSFKNSNDNTVITANAFSGDISDVAVYSYALTPQQAIAHYDARLL